MCVRGMRVCDWCVCVCVDVMSDILMHVYDCICVCEVCTRFVCLVVGELEGLGISKAFWRK